MAQSISAATPLKNALPLFTKMCYTSHYFFNVGGHCGK